MSMSIFILFSRKYFLIGGKNEKIFRNSINFTRSSGYHNAYLTRLDFCFDWFNNDISKIEFNEIKIVSR